jgi:argininosuccinate synthase
MTRAETVSMRRPPVHAGDHARDALYRSESVGQVHRVWCGRDPWNEPPDDIYTLTKARTHDSPAYVEIEWRRGCRSRSTARDVVRQAITSLRRSRHAVGRIDMVENRLPGSKSRERAAPAAAVLHAAHRELKAVIPRSQRRSAFADYADLVCGGLYSRRRGKR